MKIESIGEVIEIPALSSAKIIAPLGETWIIKNIFIPKGVSVKIYATDGVNDVLLDERDASMLDYNFVINDKVYLRIDNPNNAEINVAYTGYALVEG